MMLEGNEAVASVAFRLSEVIAIYPITPSSGMGELSDQWAGEHRTNIWGQTPSVIEMQSEGGAAGAVHGSLQAGALTTTFTASQGLLLMIPNMYKIAGELTPLVIHVASRALAAQGLSIFGDHSDVMACRATGFAMLSSGSVQEAADLAAIAHASTLESRIPFLHFFDGFRTSHEINQVDVPTDIQLTTLIDEQKIADFRSRALSPDHPCIRGTAQNPDVYFQARETVNPWYIACPEIVQSVMDRFAEMTGRAYHLVDYYGAADAERVIVIMGSGGEAILETVEHLNRDGARVGVIRVRLYRPFPAEQFVAALPPTVKTLAVLDRCKEPGSIAEPLALDVIAALQEYSTGVQPKILRGRYGLASKEFTPAMIQGIYQEMAGSRPRRQFTVGIIDDVTHQSIAYNPEFSTEGSDVVRCVFFGLGADGTVGANKNAIKIIGDETDNYAQGYFVYDSKKSGSMTVSHLRFGPRPIRSTYLIRRATFVACHHFPFLDRIDVLQYAEHGATFLLNAPVGPDEIWSQLPRSVQQAIIDKQLKFYVINAVAAAAKAGLGGRISTIMQTCFFRLTNVMPFESAVAEIKKAIEKTFGKRGATIVEKNFAAVDAAIENLHVVEVPATVSAIRDRLAPVPAEAPEFVQRVTAQIVAGCGDGLPVSALPVDGTWPSGTTQWERRSIAHEIPVWDESICIQCGKCVLVCPHAVIRAKICEPELLTNAPAGFRTSEARWPDRKSERFTLQIAPDDCTGCGVCVDICPVKNKTEVRFKAVNMRPIEPLLADAREHWDFFQTLPDPPRETLRHNTVKDVQLLDPLFEFSGACAGCGETPYLKLLTQLFGDRLLIANATGCSSIYGGNLPTTPWSFNSEGRGPAWSNSLFEDNAEFGLGMRLALDEQQHGALLELENLRDSLGAELVDDIRNADQSTETGISLQRRRIDLLKAKLRQIGSRSSRRLHSLADALVRKSVWIIGGDGWAYDIGFGGLDHVLASGRNVKVLVLDTEVYSNTGGQASKATPLGAVAKFASEGNTRPKKDLGLMAMTYGNVYVARVALGANDAQTLKAFEEAEQYHGPAIIIAYSHCIAHGYDLLHGNSQQKSAVQAGYWPLLRFDPRRKLEGESALQLDSKAPSLPLEKYAYNETRFTLLKQSHPKEAEELLHRAEHDIRERWRLYERLAGLDSGSQEKSHP